MSFNQPRRTIRHHRILIALSLIGTLYACTAWQDKTKITIAEQQQEQVLSTPAKDADPMAFFARMLPGEWRQTSFSGFHKFHTWYLGPGKHSIRRMTDGAGAGGQPWHEMAVFYWHPGRKQVCLLGMSPYAKVTKEGTIRFEGETANVVFDVYQYDGKVRKMVMRWEFKDPDKFRDTLLEETAPDSLKTLVEFDQIRLTGPPARRQPTESNAVKRSELPNFFESLLGHAWEAKGEWDTGETIQSHSTFEWIPYADIIYSRTIVKTNGGMSSHVLDTYFYFHMGTKKVRCLALSNQGGVYEGDLTVRDGSMQIKMIGYEGDQVVEKFINLGIEKDGTLRQRLWNIEGAKRTLNLDLHHRKFEPKGK